MRACREGGTVAWALDASLPLPIEEQGSYADPSAPVRHLFRRQANVTTLMGEVVAVDAAQRQVRLADGSALPYDHLVVAVGAVAAVDPPSGVAVLGVLAVPAIVSLAMWRTFVAEARLAQSRIGMERRAVEVLDQEERAPRMWAERLAPESLPDLVGFEVMTRFLG